METWPARRVARAKIQPITCERFEASQDGTFVFEVRGATGEKYDVEIDEHLELWPPRCTCEDNAWRPDLLCKHIVFCLLQMGADERKIREWFWEPESQEEVYELLMNAPNVVE